MVITLQLIIKKLIYNILKLILKKQHIKKYELIDNNIIIYCNVITIIIKYNLILEVFIITINNNKCELFFNDEEIEVGIDGFIHSKYSYINLEKFYIHLNNILYDI